MSDIEQRIERWQTGLGDCTERYAVAILAFGDRAMELFCVLEKGVYSES